MTNEQLQAQGEAYWPDASPETQLNLATKLHAAKQWMRERREVPRKQGHPYMEWRWV
jgi:hypothetical protein